MFKVQRSNIRELIEINLTITNNLATRGLSIIITSNPNFSIEVMTLNNIITGVSRIIIILRGITSNP